MTKTDTTPKALPRDQIAAQLSDLRQMRFAIADLQGIAWGFINLAKSSGEIPADLRADMEAAIGLIDRADKVASARMVELYSTPTLTAANDLKEEAA